MSEIQVGDTVQLKSGGPIMSVQEFDESGYAECIWFEKKQKQRAMFRPATLKKATPGLGSAPLRRV